MLIMISSEFEQVEKLTNDVEWINDHGLLVRPSKYLIPIYTYLSNERPRQRIIMFETSSCDSGSVQYERGIEVSSAIFTVGLDMPGELTAPHCQEWLKKNEFNQSKCKGLTILNPTPHCEAYVCINMEPEEIADAFKERYNQ